MKLLFAFFVLVGLALGVYVYAPQSFEKTATPDERSMASGGATGLVSVDRSNRGLTKFPSEVLSMSTLQSLDISRNALTGAMPAEIRLLQDLEVLDASYNKMTGLPAELGQLKKLRILNVSRNQLTGLPHELGNLSNLEVLNLSGNAVSQQDLDTIRARLPSSTQIIL